MEAKKSATQHRFAEGPKFKTYAEAKAFEESLNKPRELTRTRLRFESDKKAYYRVYVG